jgi:hypothetical protein
MSATQQQQQTAQQVAPTQAGNQQVAVQGQQQQQMYGVPARAEGYRPAAIRESRIKDRPYSPVEASLKIKIELDLEVEVDLYARVKGDVTIGLM